MTTEERLATLEREQAETKAKLAQLEKALKTQRQEVRARSFVVVDENGKTRAMMDMYKGGPRLLMFDENSKARTALGMTEHGARLRLFDENGARAELRTGKEGPALILWDENGQNRALLGASKTLTPDGTTTTSPESSLLLSGADGKVRWSAP